MLPHSSLQMDGWLARFQPPRKTFCDLRGSPAAQCTLPYSGHTPAVFSQRQVVASVPRYVPVEFAKPKFWSRRWRCSVPAVLMTVPKAALDVDHRPPAGKHDVWHPWQLSVVEAEPQAPRMKRPPECHFRPSVLTLYYRHHFGAGGLINYVCQSPAPWHCAANLVWAAA